MLETKEKRNELITIAITKSLKNRLYNEMLDCMKKYNSFNDFMNDIIEIGLIERSNYRDTK